MGCRKYVLVLFAAVAHCGGETLDARDARIVEALTAADLPLLRSRPSLVAGRYARMAAAPYDFYRGSLALFLRDWRDASMSLSRSAFSLDNPQPLALGDPHPENFGTLLGADGVLRLEANDLDAVDRLPYLWDLRRLTVGLCLAARLANPDDPVARTATRAAARSIAEEAARSYADALRGAVPAITEGAGSTLLDDLFRRARRDASSRTELAALTVMNGPARRLRRGAPDPEDPQNRLVDLPSWARDALPGTLSSYQRTLQVSVAQGFFTVLDAAREFGSGVASWPRARVLVLVRGESDGPDDDLVLDLKELADPLSPGSLPPAVWWNDVGARVASGRTAWSRPDAEAFWSVSIWLGMPVQIRAEREAHKTVRVSRMNGPAGAPASLRALARSLGSLLARAHGRTLPDGRHPGEAIASVIARDPAGFVREQGEVSEAYATTVLEDAARFRALVATRGPRLGFVDEEPGGSLDLRTLLFGGSP